MTLRRTFYLLIMCLCASFSAAAQQAHFTADKTSGCSPLAISFTNTSTGFSPAAIYNWDFGNTNSSTLKNPGTTYKDEGIYTVTLTVTDGIVTSTDSMEITVYQKPVVDFSVDVTKGCLPLDVTFVSHSTPGDGTISIYTWDFGDGVAIAGTDSLVHTYTIPKVISPSLTVTNSHGCYNTLSKSSLIEVLPALTASFQSDQTVYCTSPETVSFTNTSSGATPLTYNWDFGDGNTATDVQPTHTYEVPGTYSVKLSVTNADGCVSEKVLSKYLNVDDFHTDFNVPVLLCQNTAALFTDASSPAATAQTWLVNGTVVPNTQIPQLQYIFTAPGTYEVKLANVYETCPDTATKTVTVKESPDTRGFTFDLQGTCGAPVTVLFADTTQNATGWEWDFTGSGQFTGAGRRRRTCTRQMVCTT